MRLASIPSSTSSPRSGSLQVVRPRTYAHTVSWLRRVARLLTGPLGRKRAGHFYIWSRVALARVYGLAERASVPRGIELVALDDLPRRAIGATYREVEPPVVGVTPPAGWSWPPAFVPTPRPQPVAAYGQGVVEIPGGVVFGSRG